MGQNSGGRDPDTSRLNLQEGEAMNYFLALQEVFGGEVSTHAYGVENATSRIRMNSYPAEPGMEIILTEAWFDSDLAMSREPDRNREYVHIYLVLEGTFNQSFKKSEVTVEAGTLKGAFAYNGLFHMNVLYPARQGLRSVAIKIHRESLETLLPEALDLFTSLFSDPEGVAYHARIPAELEKLCLEMFHFRDADFGSRSLVVARGMEALVILFDTIRKMRKNRELNGLHEDDFSRLQRIKNHILGHLDERISLEKLASEFGISVSKLKRDFKSLFDSSVYQFYTYARMDEAYRRLKSGKYSVMEVGYDLGYQNLSKFSEMFKKTKGISPSEVI
jgi:AraC-like DNA-binding protein